MSQGDKPMDRRAFLEVAAVSGGVTGMASIAGCLGDEGADEGEEGEDVDTPESADEEELGDPIPTFTYFNNPEDYNPARHDAINLITEQLNETGLDVEVEVFEWGTLFTKVSEEYEFDFTTWHRGLGVDPGRRLTEMFHSSNTDPGEGNFFGYENPDLDPTLDEQLGITDPDERAEMLHDIQAVLAEDVPMFPMVEMPSIMAYNNEQVSGWSAHPGGMGYFYNMINIEVDNPENRLVGTWSEGIETLSPVGHSNQTKVLHQLDVMYDFLVRHDSDLEFDPELSLAQSIDRPDKQSAVVEIRDDAQFQDGEPLTAEDVAFSYNYISEQEIPVYHAEGEMIDGAEATGEYTVEIEFTQEIGPFGTLLGVRLPIIPKHIWENVDNPAQYRPDEDELVGSGVMEFDYWDEGSELSLVENEDHWLDTDFDQRIWRIIPEISTNWELLERGEVNYLPFSRIGREMNEREQESQISVKTEPGDSWWFCGMNLRKPGLDEKAVRQAAVHGLPRTAIVKQLLYGYPEPGKSVIPQGFGMYHNPDVKEYEEGADHAWSRLDEAGFVFDDDGRAHYPAE